MNTDTSITTVELDRWRAGLLDAQQAHAVRQAMQSDIHLAERAQFGTQVVAGLAALPQLAARRRPAHRKLRWPRVMAAGLVSVTVAVFTITVFPLLSSRTAMLVPPAQLNAQVNPQLADAVQNMDFYEWLAAHPQALQDVRHGNSA
jgi:hypothetical protein